MSTDSDWVHPETVREMLEAVREERDYAARAALEARASLEQVRALAEVLRPVTPDWHAVVQGEHLPPCIACLILGALDDALAP